MKRFSIIREMYEKGAKILAKHIDEEIYWSMVPHRFVLDDKKYRGRGRPRKQDYYRVAIEE